MSFNAQIFGGVKWTSLSMIFVTGLHFLTLVILARFLDASDFGLMAIIMVVIGFSQAFMDMGVSNAIIQRQDVNHAQLSSLYWLNIVSGFVVSGIVMLVAPLIASFYDNPALTNMLRLLAIVFVVISIGNQFRVLCQKEMQFKRMAIGEMSAAFCAFAVAVFSAMQGFGVYALIFAMLTQSSVSSLYFLGVGLKNHHRPTLRYNHGELEGFFSFGLYQMGEKLTNYIYNNVDNILIGKILGMEALGFYNLAWQLCIVPIQRINPVVNKIAFPLYSKLQGQPEELDKHYRSFLRTIALIMVPIFAFLFFFSEEIVFIVYGEGWGKTATLITFLSLVGILRALGNPGGSLVLSAGRADIAFWWTLGAMIAIAATVYGTLSFAPNIEAVTFALLIYSLIFSVIWHIIIVRISHVTYAPILKHSTRIAVLSFGTAFLAFEIVDFLSMDQQIIRVLVAGGICATIYAVYIVLFEKNIMNAISNRNAS